MHSNSSTFTRSYRIRNDRMHLDPPREIKVQSSPEQVAQLERDGYLVRERLLPPDLIEMLREAADTIEAETLKTRQPGQGDFGGLFVRDIIDRHPAFLQMLDYPPLVSVARAVLGPQVQLHASVLRVSYPDLPKQGVPWHFHQRVVPDPIPPFFLRPTVIDNLIYLDDLTADTGPFALIPGSHLLNEALPPGDHQDKPGQVVVTVPSGSVITSHSSLWHKAFPTRPGGTKRRLLIWGYSPIWLKQIDLPSAGRGWGLTDSLLDGADDEKRELLGLSGYY